ncbi:sodium/proline symporter [Caldibacillus thermoamylovorans]|uniref:sodium/proline symporter n=1 Tax=Caldibacillus thermoamylovorans TaxID=35841 RepID=UPI001D0959C7|nr:sodium/proline symporter [Caldibacillus thermoamylovorans]MCB5936855.1 sodium/proline symporter [Bacillus sp. DFI.2.34]MCB7078499.1 sodium/proline symporter [Caldibacillus thermoamylovorans]
MFNVIVFSAYIVMLLVIGFITYKRTTSSEDYSLAGRSNNKWVTAISASSSDMSGWLLLGLPGLAFVSGYGAIWTLSGLILGSLFNWTVVANRLRTITAHYNANSLSEYFEKRVNDKKGLIAILSAIIIVLFMIINASAEIIGSGKLLKEVFGLTYTTGIVISLVVVLIYTFLGGYLAVSWSNLIQGTIMVIALLIVPIAGIMSIGGVNNLFDSLQSIDPSLLTFTGGDAAAFAIFGFVISGLGIGVGYPGQPHVLTSFMAIKNPDEIRHSTVIALVWIALTTYGAVIVGMTGRVLSPDIADPETVFLVMSKALFSSNTIGLFAAAVMAAILSSVSAYLLVAGASVSTNVYRKFKKNNQNSLAVERISVFVIGILAFVMSLAGGVVFEVALFAWGGLAASFGPFILASLYWKKLNYKGAVWSMIVGMLVNLVWYYSGLSNYVYELIPAIILSTLTLIVVSLSTKGPDAKTQETYESYLKAIKK